MRVQTVGDGDKQAVVLHAKESARVERQAKSGQPRLVKSETAEPAPKFVRRLVKPPQTLDLLDIIAGGNGLGHRRERGIDPTTGMEDPLFTLGERVSDRQFHPVAWHKLIDGVFIPVGGRAVIVDSAGHAFDGFPATEDKTWGSIWPRAADVDPENERKGWIYEVEHGERFMPERRGMIGVCPNVGITFDLAAVRAMHTDSRPARLRTIAGLGDRAGFESPYDGKVDLWVIVDGDARQKRLGLKRSDGTFKIDVQLTAADRFLALVATDGGDGRAGDWVIFGDPVLQMKPIAEKP